MNTENKNDSTQVTFSQVYNDVKGALEGIADALKTGAEHVYEVLVMQQAVNSITWLLVIAGLAGATAFMVKVSRRIEDQDSEQYIFTMIGTGLCGISTVIVFALTIGEIVTGFVNPEYGAMMEIKSFIK